MVLGKHSQLFFFLLCVLIGASGCRFAVKPSDKSATSDLSAVASANNQIIAGDESVQLFANNARRVVGETLRQIQAGGESGGWDQSSFGPLPLCPDRHPSCLKANLLTEPQIAEVIQFLNDTLLDMYNLNAWNPVPLQFSAVPPLVKGADGEEVARQVVAHWTAPQRIVLDHKWFKDLIQEKSASDAMRMLVKDIGHELSHLVVAHGARLLDETRTAAFDTADGGFQKAEAVGAYLSYIAHRNGIIGRNTTQYAPAMAAWSCANLDGSPDRSFLRASLATITSDDYQLSLEGGNNCSDITVGVKLLDPNTLFHVTLICEDHAGASTKCHHSDSFAPDFVIKANQRTTYTISREQMEQLTGGHALRVNMEMFLYLRRHIPGTGACGEDALATVAKFGAFLGRVGEGVPTRTCGI